MSKGLEALKELKERLFYLCFGYYVGEQVETIEKELKDYETFKTGLILGNISIVDNKILKALEIIKEKVVDIYLLYATKNLEDYNSSLMQYNANLTQEEYDLLKEVLL